jgi:hypothetical protein
VHASHEALTIHSPVAHPGSPWLTLLARCECLKRHGVGERGGELGADFSTAMHLEKGPLVIKRVPVQSSTHPLVADRAYLAQGW